MTKWEYKVIEFDSTGIMGGLVDTKNVENQLNELGKLGWGLVSAYSTVGSGTARKVIYNLKKESEF
ncbi:MAG: DUF4177 domain-containing protein [Candidatus Marinimicrobia bacterium]|nr:DUF4177 domain-containing protein [Candidatus Neomarinimicrobiota bacterium]